MVMVMDPPSSISAALIFSSSLAKRLETNSVRLPPTYVGVRRVRPSWENASSPPNEKRPSHETDEASKRPRKDTDEGLFARNAPGVVSYKVTNDDGSERRMTNQEKKNRKFELRKQRKSDKKQMKHQPPPTTHTHTDTREDATNVNGTSSNTKEGDLSQHNYHQIEVKHDEIEEELAEIRNKRPPPAMVPAAMAHVGIRTGALPLGPAVAEPEPTDVDVLVDDELAARWARAIKESMREAEVLRSRDPSRPMAYQLVPEVWNRMRPLNVQKPDGPTPPAEKSNGRDSQWTMVPMRKAMPSDHNFESLLFDQLHQLNGIHASCGAKFGSNYLLYDGRRDERHAFAGLRVETTTRPTTTGTVYFDTVLQLHLPIPSPYDLAGYVRGLNTAGKLALLATAVRSESTRKVHVLFLDIALEKILSAPTHQRSYKQRNQNARKEIGHNLSKIDS